MKKLILLAAILSTLLVTSCTADNTQPHENSSSGATVTGDTRAKPITADKNAVSLQGLSTEKIGYGQGVQVDDQNVPLGAKDFNSAYGKLNAAAINEESDKILLTFDQGYENGYTAKILDTLKEKHVKAVFFLLKDYAEKNPDLVKRMIDEGHVIGNHSVHHYSMPDLDKAACEKEITEMHDYVKENFGVEMSLFRPPMGEFSQYSLGVTANCGYRTMMWSFAYADWDTTNQPDRAEALDKLINGAHKGAVYLLHSVSQTNADVLGEVIDKIRENGFEFESN